LANHAYKDACLVTNPRHANLADLETIYREAM
jgi:alcohol dehydrogenase